MTEETESTPPAGLAGTWAILELMGHQSIAGWVTEEHVAGKPMLRVDVPGDASFHRFYSASALYAITPCSEEDVLNYVGYYQPKQAPVHLPPAPSLLPAGVEDDPDDYGAEELPL